MGSPCAETGAVVSDTLMDPCASSKPKRKIVKYLPRVMSCYHAGRRVRVFDCTNKGAKSWANGFGDGVTGGLPVTTITMKRKSHGG